MVRMGSSCISKLSKIILFLSLLQIASTRDIITLKRRFKNAPTLTALLRDVQTINRNDKQRMAHSNINDGRKMHLVEIKEPMFENENGLHNGLHKRQWDDYGIPANRFGKRNAEAHKRWGAIWLSPFKRQGSAPSSSATREYNMNPGCTFMCLPTVIWNTMSPSKKTRSFQGSFTHVHNGENVRCFPRNCDSTDYSEPFKHLLENSIGTAENRNVFQNEQYGRNGGASYVLDDDSDANYFENDIDIVDPLQDY
ncbi:unnamed protein product [Owenia fusiformis]|uniref:Uncharacterized protein n=1 Tax=Owenia fusiformis TaxID=6347 RepID=A0A8J1UM76_OWEFU|nr:unnamed protein product [Owenia fusiformis]